MGIPNQPALPPEGTFGEIERLIIEESPKNLWPDNQNSNAGALRQSLASVLQEGADEVTELFNEMFVTTSEKHLTRHEYQYGLPFQTDRPLELRRGEVLARLRKEPFTRTRIKNLVELYISATFGESPQFGPEGIPLTPDGIILFGDTVSDVTTLYRVYEQVLEFSYEVWIVNSLTPGATLLRELERITPGGETVTIDNTRSQILDYVRTVLNAGPTAYWRFNDPVGMAADNYPGLSTGQWNPGNAATLGAGGLIHASVETATSFDFNGVDDYLVLSTFGPYEPSIRSIYGISVEGWIRPDTVGGSIKGILKAGNWELQINSNGKLMVTFSTDLDTYAVEGTTVLSAATTYFWSIVFDGSEARLYLNGNLEGIPVAVPGPLGDFANVWEIGRVSVSYFDGRIQHLAVYGYPLSAAEILKHYKTGINVV